MERTARASAHVSLSGRVLPHFWLGLVLIVFFWAASWGHFPVIGEYAFLPQWLGYILTVDALVVWRRGDSLLTTRPRTFLALFFISAPIWWLFEGLNLFTLNWHYIIPEDYSIPHIIVHATISFSVVIPAVFETAMLLSTFPFIQKLERPTARRLPTSAYWLIMYIGAGMFFAFWLLPGIAFGLIWVWLFLLVDAQNALMHRPSLIEQAARGDYRKLIALALATLICGFFWEMWNFWAFPKWYYTVPIIGFWKVFEMPLLGFVGYIPFSWELYALYQFICGILKLRPVI
ncbi:MAG TPA: hypothetical protein VFD70_14885 [Anaerolineae bacterium]|nr:hypothetical protein [Anaerolineae bacterium]